MATGQLEIDLGAIVRNWRALAAMAGGARAGAVVKAEAYGLGAAPVARALLAAGARHFFVATAEEGAGLRAAIGPDPEIFVFSGHMSGDLELLRDARLVPLLNSPEQARRHFAALPDHPFGVQLDTGMNRLGLEPDQWAALAPDLLARHPRLVMSHLACADIADHPMNARQLAAFEELTRGISVPRSLAATGGIQLGPAYHFDIVRPGVGIYGGMPFAAAEPVVRLDIPVIQIRDVGAGESVGYGNAFVAEAPMRVATLAAGYADGVFRAAGPRLRLFADTTACPVVGRISMDMIAVDVTHLPRPPAALTLLGPQQGIDAVAAAAGTIGYEILTALGSRYRRHYLP